MTPAEFKTMLPEFACESDARIQLEINAAAPFFDVCRWDGFYPEGLRNFVAHRIAVANIQTAAGAATSDINTSKKIGDLQVNRSPEMIMAQASNPYMLTRYGQQYLYLRRLAGLGAIAV
jgi:Protein of unknown function (DUF4054)